MFVFATPALFRLHAQDPHLPALSRLPLTRATARKTTLKYTYINTVPPRRLEGWPPSNTRNTDYLRKESEAPKCVAATPALDRTHAHDPH